MRKFLISLLVGVIAGIIDIIPMIMQKLDNYANFSAFIFWVVMGIIINYSAFNLPGFLKGMIIALISSVPIVIMVSKNGIRSAVPILIMTVILGAIVGFFGQKFAK